MLAYIFGIFVILFTLYQKRRTPDHETALKALWGYGTWIGVGIVVSNFLFIQFIPGG